MGVLAFVFGLIFGSFFNVVIYRLPRGQSLIRPGSHCPSCGHPLAPLDLLPLLSFIFFRGRCRYCGGAISRRYPLVELLTGALFVLAVYLFGLSWEALAAIVFLSLALIISFIDLDWQIIPDSLVLTGLFSGLILNFFRSRPGVGAGLAGMIIGFVLMAALFYLSGGRMGGGDVKYAAVIGLFTGGKLVWVALFLAFILGASVSLLLILSRRRSLRDPIPFGPFLALGGSIALLWGEEIFAWYLGLF
ncbi:MAG: leader peptidase (prepilin peptidase) / N-methyltransferase [Eubacteriales bacterium]|nr:leader peptidase (prepilin peptidase) / N-methyltransferase [Eubacteriales bacterium]MDN5364239.1 leader peptidase (prepilin peptidase) / N-methyltransferase [Eubacteriales bacterium]